MFTLGKKLLTDKIVLWLQEVSTTTTTTKLHDTEMFHTRRSRSSSSTCPLARIRRKNIEQWINRSNFLPFFSCSSMVLDPSSYSFIFNIYNTFLWTTGFLFSQKGWWAIAIKTVDVYLMGVDLRIIGKRDRLLFPGDYLFPWGKRISFDFLGKC